MNTDLATFRSFYEREHATTARVLRALPSDKADLRPAEKSKTAKELAFLFVGEERMILNALRGEEVLGGGMPQAPDTIEAIVEAFDRVHRDVLKALDEANDDVMQGKVGFFVGPKQPGDFPTSTFIWFMMFDQIHHRGQLSVYLRIAGARVPSIYGPTADEPWT